MKWVDGSDTRELLKFHPKEIFLRNYLSYSEDEGSSFIGNENKWIVQDQSPSEV